MRLFYQLPQKNKTLRSENTILNYITENWSNYIWLILINV